jgi:hypothetical protein
VHDAVDDDICHDLLLQVREDDLPSSILIISYYSLKVKQK